MVGGGIGGGGDNSLIIPGSCPSQLAIYDVIFSYTRTELREFRLSIAFQYLIHTIMYTNGQRTLDIIMFVIGFFVNISKGAFLNTLFITSQIKMKNKR